MNRSSIEWTDYTWNPVTGCNHGCTYCYARRLAEGRLRGRFGYDNGFEPTFHQNRLTEPSMVKKPSMIFTCSMGDLFGNWVPQQWISSVLVFIKINDHHQFQILTKNPIRMSRYRNIPKNAWLGTSIDGLGNSIDRLKILSDAPFNGHIRFASFEPLLADVVSQSNFTLENIDWIIVGAQTGPNAKSPEVDWISDLGLAARKAKVPVFLKDNLPWPNYHFVPGMKRAQEFPLAYSKGEDESNGN